MTDVFISYKREERDKVVLIADRLRALGLDVWFDARLTTGHHFDREIDDHVRNAKCVLVCWSPGALMSEWVRAESAIGRERNVLVPLMIEACSPPVPFNTLQTEDLAAWAGEADHEGWMRAVDQIASLVQRPEIAGQQRARGQQERDLRRTQALLEAQRREEEEAQRRAVEAAGKRAELEAQVAALAPTPPAPQMAPAAPAPLPTASQGGEMPTGVAKQSEGSTSFLKTLLFPFSNSARRRPILTLAWLLMLVFAALWLLTRIANAISYFVYQLGTV